ncbi:MAG: hypothetical protein OEZ06_23220 [Myxococcales bacterium]|nr:hypothetical protein [Myxococcales bacterium]
MSDGSHWLSQVQQAFGLLPREDWPRQLERALAEGGFAADGSAELGPLHRLAAELTVGETHFFRYPNHFELLKNRLAARLAQGGAPLSVWSAGCSSGEEPYSLGMLVKASLGSEALSRLSMLATDVSPAALYKARRAVYSRWSFRGVDPLYLKRFFRPADGGFELCDRAVREAVVFTLAGIEQQARQLPAASYDVIIFRNVAIYLAPEALLRMYGQFARALRPDGWLLVAPSDPRPPRQLFRYSSVHPEDSTVLEPVGVCAGATAAPPTFQPTFAPPVLQPPMPMEAPVPAPAQHLPSPPPPPSPPALPPPPSPSLERALSLADAGRLAEARAQLEALRDLSPDDGRLLLYSGQLHLHGRDPEAALVELRRAVYLDGGDVMARFYLATTLLSLGRNGQAQKQLDAVERALQGQGSDRVDSAAELLIAVERLRQELR